MRGAVLLASLVVCVLGQGYFWHLTDIHYQPQYYEGASVVHKCISGNGTAGYWGSLDGPCDLPQTTLIDTFEFMRNTLPKPDFILYTGDMVPHEPLDMDDNGVIQYQNNITYYFQKYFPGITIFPILGNHDSHPEFQMYDYEYWLYDETAVAWSPFLDSNMQATFKQGGYYTKLISTGFRLVALNTAMYFTENDYIDPNIHSDPAGMMEWVDGILATAKANGERVLMIYHIPPGYNAGMLCQFYNVYNDLFVNTITPYSSIIVGHFMGHDHLDFLRLFGDQSQPSTISTGFVAGSLTPWDLANPRVRLFLYEKTAPFTLLDYISYQFDLVAANLRQESVWIEEYRATAEYDIPDLSGASMLQLYQNMQTNETLVDRYLSHWKGVAWVGDMCAPFSVCRDAAVCSIGNLKWEDWESCMAN
ncbi:sphingomyelin phosphodiesterase acid-like 3 [Pelomyxa schiedti]|nr:sphingomyelin phosphodiesterase acid-like 3 [Pelomyxa schiedti]